MQIFKKKLSWAAQHWHGGRGLALFLLLFFLFLLFFLLFLLFFAAGVTWKGFVSFYTYVFLGAY